MRLGGQSSGLAGSGNGGIAVERYGNLPIATWTTGQGRMALIGQLPDQDLTALAKILDGG
jgi:hypothetical protein